MAARVSDAQLAVLADVAGQIGKVDGYTFGEGASRLGLNGRSLQTMLRAGLLEQTDTGDPDTCGGRYRLHLTGRGRNQLRRALDDNLLTLDRSRTGNRANVGAFLARVTF